MLLTIGDNTQNLEDWAADYGIPCHLIRSRLKRGWNEERAVTEPMVVRRGEKLGAGAMLDVLPAPRPIVPSPFIPTERLFSATTREVTIHPRSILRTAAKYEHAGKCMTMRGWADHLGVSLQAMSYRLKKRPASAFDPPTPGRRCKGQAEAA